MIILGTVIIWSNGTVTAFDLDGNQVPDEILKARVS